MMIGNPVLFGEGDSPSDTITRVGWIKSDGTSYIDLGVQPASYAWRLLFTLPKFTDFSADRTCVPIIHAATGNDASADRQTAFGIYETASTYTFYLTDGDVSANRKSTGTSSINTSYLSQSIDMFFETRGVYWPDSGSSVYISGNNPAKLKSSSYYSDAEVSSITCTKSSSKLQPESNLHLFGLPSATKTDIAVRGITFFTKSAMPGSTKVYDIVSIYRSFYPAVKNGAAGLYDPITNTFLGNSAESGTILYGD